jgi:hypothetical protein
MNASICTYNNVERYFRAAEVNDHIDVYSNTITYVSKNMTMKDIMETLQEISIRFPFSDNYRIQFLETGVRCGPVSATSITIDKLRGTITVS